jgi:hypothetical protein
MHAGYVFANFNNFAGNFVTENDWNPFHAFLCPFVPVPYVNISAAYGGSFNLDQHFVFFDRGTIYLGDFGSRLSLTLDNGVHFLQIDGPPLLAALKGFEVVNLSWLIH